MPKKVRVMTADAELNLEMKASATGQELFDLVVKEIGVHQVEYFGLQFTHSKKGATWLKPEKKVLDHNVRKESPMQFKFLIKFYPEDVAKELVDDTTLRLFYHQLRKSILSDDIYCPDEKFFLLASYALQAEYGDYDDDQLRTPGAYDGQLLPQRIVEQHVEWRDRVSALHAGHKTMRKEGAMKQYLQIVNHFDMYGISHFEYMSKDKKATVHLGLCSQGLNVYEKGDKSVPSQKLEWSAIDKIKYDHKNFSIKLADSKAKKVVLKSKRFRTNVQVLKLCKGNHLWYVKHKGKENPDTSQVVADVPNAIQVAGNQQDHPAPETVHRPAPVEDAKLIEQLRMLTVVDDPLPSKVRTESRAIMNECLAELSQRSKLVVSKECDCKEQEKSAAEIKKILERDYEEICRLGQELDGTRNQQQRVLAALEASKNPCNQDDTAYLENLKALQEEAKRSRMEAIDAMDRVHRLEAELKEVHDRSERASSELSAMIERLERDKEMSAAEKLELTEEIRIKQVVVEEIAQEVKRREQETQLLREQVEEVTRRQVLVETALLRAMAPAQDQHADRLKAMQEEMAAMRAMVQRLENSKEADFAKLQEEIRMKEALLEQAIRSKDSDVAEKLKLQEEIRMKEAKFEQAIRCKDEAEAAQDRHTDLWRQMQLEIRHINEKLNQLEKVKTGQEVLNAELRAIIERLEQGNEMSSTEKMKLEEEIRIKQAEVDDKEIETRCLQQEVDEFRTRQREIKIESQEKIRDLEQQLDDARRQLELSQKQLHDLEQLIGGGDMENCDKLKLEQRVQLAKAEVERKDHEARRLQQEVDQAKALTQDRRLIASFPSNATSKIIDQDLEERLKRRRSIIDQYSPTNDDKALQSQNRLKVFHSLNASRRVDLFESLML